MSSLNSQLCAVLDEVSPLWGVCDYDAVSDYIIPCRAVSRLPENAKSIICGVFPYNLGDGCYEGSNISRYAVVPDYNDAVHEMLENAAAKLRAIYPGERFEAFCGNSPLPEVCTAQLAGLGEKGVNGLLITEKYGSWVFIGEIVTTLLLEPTKKRASVCDGCGKCIEACPTGALSEDGFDRAKCLSYISQQKEPLSPGQEALIKSTGCVWGCDICQTSCPKNNGVQYTTIDEFIKGAVTRAEPDGSLDGRAFGWRGKKVIERNLKLFKQKDGVCSEADNCHHQQ